MNEKDFLRFECIISRNSFARILKMRFIFRCCLFIIQLSHISSEMRSTMFTSSVKWFSFIKFLYFRCFILSCQSSIEFFVFIVRISTFTFTDLILRTYKSFFRFIKSMIIFLWWISENLFARRKISNSFFAKRDHFHFSIVSRQFLFALRWFADQILFREQFDRQLECEIRRDSCYKRNNSWLQNLR